MGQRGGELEFLWVQESFNGVRILLKVGKNYAFATIDPLSYAMEICLFWTARRIELIYFFVVFAT